MLISLCFILSFSILNSVNHPAVLSHYPTWYSKIVFSLGIWCFIINIFLYHPSVDELFSDFEQRFCWSYTVHSLLTPLHLCCFCCPYFSSSIIALIPFLFMLYFLSSSWYFSFHLISPHWWHSKIFMCFLTSFVAFLSFFSTRLCYFYFQKLQGQYFFLSRL